MQLNKCEEHGLNCIVIYQSFTCPCCDRIEDLGSMLDDAEIEKRELETRIQEIKNDRKGT